MIAIGKPHISSRGGKSRLAADVDIDGTEREVWFEVDSALEQYLCHERGDAFAVAVLNYAMRHGHDIVSKAPLGEDLYYQLTTDLIPVLAANSGCMHPTRLDAEVDSALLTNAGAVGTGISCGIDSFHVLATESQAKFPKHRLTHLAFNNVGSHGEGEQAQKLFAERRALARRFCEEYGFAYVEGNSNLQDVIPQNHYLSHTYSSMFPVLALQKLYSVYYYASSGHPYGTFSVKDNEKDDCAKYELLSLRCFSSHSLLVYPEGGGKNRFEKVQAVVRYPPSRKYLNVCTDQFRNCGKCEKCIRTLLALDALGKLEDYATVFDIADYKARSGSCYARLVKETLGGNDMYAGMYPLLENRIPRLAKIIGTARYAKSAAARFAKKCARTVWCFK